MTADLIIKNANVFMTYRQCFEKRDVAVAGERPLTLRENI